MKRTEIDVRALFDSKAREWERKYAPRGPLVSRVDWFDTAVRNFVGPPAKVLDFGCGSGHLARRLADSGFEVTGCDISHEMMREARRESAPHHPQLSWVDLEAESGRLPFPDGSFDAVVASSVFEYLEAPLPALSELRRSLRHPGVMLCTVPNPTHAIRRAEAILAVAARHKPFRQSVRASRRLSNYVEYLRLSTNRMDAAGWDRLGRASGFNLTVSTQGTQPAGTLMMLVLATIP